MQPVATWSHEGSTYQMSLLAVDETAGGILIVVTRPDGTTHRYHEVRTFSAVCLEMWQTEPDAVRAGWAEELLAAPVEPIADQDQLYGRWD